MARNPLIKNCMVWQNTPMGLVCKGCGHEKPRFDKLDQFKCPGPTVVSQNDLKKRRQHSIPSLMLGFCFRQIAKAEIRVEGDQLLGIGAEIVQAIEVSSVRPFAGLDVLTMQFQAQQALRDAEEIWRSVDADTDPRRHTLAVCMMIMKLVDQALLEPSDQAVNVAMAILNEAQDQKTFWRYEEGSIQPLSDNLIRRAQVMGYYTGLRRPIS